MMCSQRKTSAVDFDFKSPNRTKRIEAQVFGTEMEFKARELLISLGYQILDARVKVGHWEVDLVAKDGQELVFIEVKARRAEAVYSDEALGGALTKNKKRFLRAAATRLLQYYEGDEFRFDILYWEQSRWRHIRDAF